jgi:hypothetical protein
MNVEPDAAQFSVTRIADDVFRLIVQSEAKIMVTAIIEEKHIIERLRYELSKLKVIK